MDFIRLFHFIDKLIDRSDAFAELHLRIAGSVEVSGGIQGVAVHIGEELIDPLLVAFVFLVVGDFLDGEDDVELRPWLSSVFLLHVVP